MLEMRDRVVLITGANGNLGAAVAKTFYEAGANLALVGRKADRIHKALPDLVSQDRVFVAPSTDLTEEKAVQTLIDAVMDIC